jgi:hypothetical protein
MRLNIGPKEIHQRQGSVSKKEIDPANVQIRPMKEENVEAIEVIDSVYLGVPRPENYRKKLGAATKGAGINTSVVAEARTSIARGL